VEYTFCSTYNRDRGIVMRNVKKSSAKIVSKVINAYKSSSTKVFFKEGLEQLSAQGLVTDSEARLLAKFAQAQNSKEVRALLVGLKSKGKSKVIKATLIPGIALMLDQIEMVTSGHNRDDQPSIQANSTGQYITIIIGATGVGAAIGTSLGGPTGTLIGAAAGMLAGGALAVAAIQADGGVPAGDGDEGEGGEGEGGGDEGGGDEG
jgi:hypothetical protein